MVDVGGSWSIWARYWCDAAGVTMATGGGDPRRGQNEAGNDKSTLYSRTFRGTCPLISYNQFHVTTRIEPVGKPYREVCLCSEFWPWMVHQPNSWSKHPGTRIEQVLAYCRAEQKYVGCIELLFCLTVTMTFGVRT